MNIISYQKKLSRINRPRIHITYEVEIEGAQKQISLPFVVGVISDFLVILNLIQKENGNIFL